MNRLTFSMLFFLYLSTFSLMSGTSHVQVQQRLMSEEIKCTDYELHIRIDYRKYKLTCPEE